MQRVYGIVGALSLITFAGFATSFECYVCNESDCNETFIGELKNCSATTAFCVEKIVEETIGNTTRTKMTRGCGDETTAREAAPFDQKPTSKAGCTVTHEVINNPKVISECFCNTEKCNNDCECITTCPDNAGVSVKSLGVTAVILTSLLAYTI